MPDEIWDEVYASLATSRSAGAGNENAFQEALMREFPEIQEDRIHLSFDGCTETMLGEFKRRLGRPG